MAKNFKITSGEASDTAVEEQAAHAAVEATPEVESAVARAPSSIAGTPGKGGVYRMVDGQRVKINRR